MSHESKLCGTALAQLCYAIKTVNNGNLKRINVQNSFTYGMEVIRLLSLKLNIDENTLKGNIYTQFVNQNYDIQKLASWLENLQHENNVVVNLNNVDTKRKLQEYLQKHHAMLPRYFYRKQGNQYHAFCECNINGKIFKTHTINKNQTLATKIAAKKMLAKLIG